MTALTSLLTQTATSLLVRRNESTSTADSGTSGEPIHRVEPLSTLDRSRLDGLRLDLLARGR
jgi:hypothetical protein